MQKVKIEPFKLIGIAIRTTNEEQKAIKEIAALWQRFMSGNILEKIPDKLDYTIYSLYTWYEGDTRNLILSFLVVKCLALTKSPKEWRENHLMVERI